MSAILADLTMTAKPNVTSIEEMYETIDRLASNKALGDDSLASLAMELARWVTEGTITPNAPKKVKGKPVVGIDHVLAAYERFQTKRGNVGQDKVIESKTQQVSKFRRFAKLGANHPNAHDFLQSVRTLRNSLDTDIVKSTYIALYDAAGMLYDKESKTHRTELTDDEMLAAVMKKGSADDTPLKACRAIVKRLEKLHEADKNTPQISKDILAMVGKYQLELEKIEAAAKFVETAASLGYSVRPINVPVGNSQPIEDVEDEDEDENDAE